MTIISPLQILPLHVVRMIVDHVVGSSRLVHDKVADGFEGHKALLLPLLSVCRNFRAAAVLRYCIICTLRLTPTSDLGGEKLCYWPTHLEQDDFPTHLYTQELNIDLDMEDICRGTALESLSRRPFSGCTFPKARTLTVSLLPISTMIYPAYRSPAPETIEKNISALIQRISIMAPVAKRAIIVVTPNSPDLPKTTLGDMYLCNFVKQLCLLTDSVEYDVYCKPVFMEQQPTGICDMVHMDMNREDHSELVMQLARRNAS
ncbi:hypothetical protein FBU31_004633 [Coemansia sp. 'formosensis']|nr:hypothetical protein FBU31_004633 [Coemansia sp. 'formosensis']